MAELSHALDRPEFGSISLGWSISTAGRLTSICGTLDRRFRAIDTLTSKELWSAQLPPSARATSMTYAVHNRQYVVIAAGGSTHITEERQSDTLVAFALPTAREATVMARR